MNYSSKKDPCPVCGRNTSDGKCRWDSNVILCYFGDKFHPPTSLLLNSKIRINGVDWKLIKTSAGFSGGSYCFVSGESFFNPRALSRVDREKFAIQSAKVTDGFIAAFSQLRKLCHQMKSAGDFFDMNIDQFRSSRIVAFKVHCRAKALTRFVRKYRNILGRQKKYKVALELWENESTYMLADYDRFSKYYLGEGILTCSSRSQIL